MSSAIDFAAIVAAIADAVVATDAAGSITVWNPGAQRIFGFTAEEALGKSMDIIIPERLRQRHWEGYEQTMSTGVTRYGADQLLKVPALHKDGRQLSIAFSIAMTQGADGRPEQVIAVIRDETARFQEDRALRKRISELEKELAACKTAS